MNPTIAFIGGGNMAGSIVGGLCQSGTPAESIQVADPSQDQLDHLKDAHGIVTSTDNKAIVVPADIVVIAVKPHLVKAVCEEIGSVLKPDALIVSIAAGVTEASISRWLGGSAAVIRCMPNTPALLKCGASALYANEQCSQAQLDMAITLMSAVGTTVQVESEPALDTVTSLSGSGPAYFFYLIEAMTDSAIKQGLDSDTASTLAIETAYGAAKMARERAYPPARLRENVTSKGGTTAAALASFSADDFAGIVERGMQAAEDRAQAMGREFGDS